MAKRGWAAGALAILVTVAGAQAQEPKADGGIKVTPVAAAPGTAAPRDPNRGNVTNLPLPRYVSLKTNEGNARRGPGLTHRIDWVFTRTGMPLRITAEFEHWRRVEDFEGAGGWVHYSLLSGVRSALVTQDMAEFRTLPDRNAAVTFQAELGVIGRILECDSAWCRMNVDGQRGWVEAAALWGVDPGEIIE
jgi:SH3-like domain-containing protein